MPERARVFIAEDDPVWQSAIGDILERSGHTVVGNATTLTQALASVKQFERLAVQVATIDGNLNAWDSSGADGRALVEAIQRLAPNVKTVGLSASGAIPGATTSLWKPEVQKLGDVINKL